MVGLLQVAANGHPCLTICEADKHQRGAPDGCQRICPLRLLLLLLLLLLLRREDCLLLLPVCRRAACLRTLKQAALRCAQLAGCEGLAVLAQQKGQQHHTQPCK